MKAALFDLDGVLVDSFEFWHSLMNSCAVACGNPSISRAALTHSWGQAPADDAHEFFGGWSAERVATYYEENASRHLGQVIVRPEAGLARDLRASGLAVGVVTNCSERLATLLLRHCALTVDVLVAADHVERPKPDPEGLQWACRQLGVEPREACFYGDSPVDRAAAAAVGVSFVGVGEREAVEKATAEGSADDAA